MDNIANLLGLKMCGMNMEEVSKNSIKLAVFKDFCPDIKTMLIYYKIELLNASMLAVIKLILYLIYIELLEKPGRIESVQLSRFLIEVFEYDMSPFVDETSLFLYT